MSATVGTTVLFSDLVGSAESSARLGAAEADRLRIALFRLLREPLPRFDGREVKNLGDGIMAVFPGVASALDAAVAMQQSAKRLRVGPSGPNLCIRIGVASGDCVEDDGDYFGEPVVQAARLCEHAEPDQILAHEVIRILDPRGRHDFVEVGDLDLKGFPEPVGAVEVVWDLEDHDDHTIPLPPRLDTRHATPYVGRELERERLRLAFKRASVGERSVVLLSGEAGLGKTRLSTELAKECFAAGALVLYGSCGEETAAAYRPWAEALGHYVVHASEADLASVGPRLLAGVARLAPAIRDRVTVPDTAELGGGDGDQYVLFSAVAGFLGALASRDPVVLVLDDLHWADRGSLQLLQHVVAAMTTSPLLIVGTYRDTDVGVDDPLTEVLAWFHREAGVERVALPGLTELEVIALMEASAGHEMDEDGIDLAHSLRLETNGNPFFVVELLRHLAESGAIAQQQDGRWVATALLSHVGLPQSVREVIGTRVRRLGARAHRMLGAAAVVGREFDVPLVADVVGCEVDELLDVLEAAARAALVTEVPSAVDTYAFTHALVQHTLYTELSASRRSRLHQRAAEAIEQLDADRVAARAGELAQHWFSAVQPTAIDRAIGYALRAGEQAASAHAPDDAVRWYRQALDAIDVDDRALRCDVMVRLGDAERQAGIPRSRQRLLDAARLARELGDDRLLVAAALANNRGWTSAAGEVDAERIAVLRAALDAVGAAPSPERARLLSTLAAELAFSDEPGRFDLVEEAVQVAHECDDRNTILDAMPRGTIYAVPHLLERNRELALEAIDLTADGADPIRRFLALNRLRQVQFASADIAGVRKTSAEMRQIAIVVGQPALLWLTTYHQAGIDLLEGRVDEAERRADEALRIGLESGQPDAMAMYETHVLMIRWHQGRTGELIGLAAQCAEDNPGLSALRVAVALIHAWSDELTEATEAFDAIARDGFAFPYDNVWPVSNVLSAETASILGDRASAEILFRRLEPFADQLAVNPGLCFGTISHYLGALARTLGRPVDAEELLMDALGCHDQLGAPFHSARTRLELAFLLAAREPSRARQLAVEVVELGERFDMPDLMTRAGRFL